MARRPKHSPPTGTSRPTDPVVVHGQDVKVETLDVDLPTAEVKHRFGGLDAMSVLAGVLAAIGTLVVLSSLAGAVGRIGFQDSAEENLSLAGLITGLLLLTLAALFGGYVAGRVARYEGMRNGLLTGIVLILLTAGLSALASQVDDVRNLELPTWLESGAGLAAILTALLAVVLVLVAATLGGRVGARWHRRVDQVLLHTRAGGVRPPGANGPPLASGSDPLSSSPRTTA